MKRWQLQRWALLVSVLTLTWGSWATAGVRRCGRKLSGAQLTHQLMEAHAEQIRAHRQPQQKRAEAKTREAYNRLACLLRRGRSPQRRAAMALLTDLVQQSSSPAAESAVRLYPRLTTRNHDRFNAATERNLRRLLNMAAGLARGHRGLRRVARQMMAKARPDSFAAQVAMMRTARRLGDGSAARSAALRALLSFEPADRLVLDGDATISQIGLGQIASITEVLRTARGRRPGRLAFNDLRLEDTLYFGRSAAPRLQAIAFLARKSRGWQAASLARELEHWQPEVPVSLTPGAHDRWISARYGARKSGRGFGYVVAAALLARRR